MSWELYTFHIFARFYYTQSPYQKCHLVHVDRLKVFLSSARMPRSSSESGTLPNESFPCCTDERWRPSPLSQNRVIILLCSVSLAILQDLILMTSPQVVFSKLSLENRRLAVIRCDGGLLVAFSCFWITSGILGELHCEWLLEWSPSVSRLVLLIPPPRDDPQFEMADFSRWKGLLEFLVEDAVGGGADV